MAQKSVGSCVCRMHALDGILDGMFVILRWSLQKDLCINPAVYFVWVQYVSGKEYEAPADKGGQHGHSFPTPLLGLNRQPS